MSGPFQNYAQRAGLTLPQGAGPALAHALPGMNSALAGGAGSARDGLMRAALHTVETGLDVAAREVRREDQEVRETKVTEATAAFRTSLMEHQNEYTEKNRGENALNAGADFQTRAGEERDRLLESFSNDPEARHMFLRSSAGAALHHAESGHSFALREKEAWKKSVFDGAVALLEKDVAENWENPAFVAHQQAVLKERAAAMYPGLDHTALFTNIDGKVKAGVAAGWEGKLAALRETDPEGAMHLAREALTGSVKLPEDVAALVSREAEAAGLDPALALAVCRTESGGRQDAASPAGARGLMQLMPGTAKDLAARYGIDPATPEGNVRGGVRYLKEMRDRYQGDDRLALMAYNWGPDNADAFVKTGKGRKGQDVPNETRKYVQKILGADATGTAANISPEAASLAGNLTPQQLEVEVHKAEAALRQGQREQAETLVSRERDLVAAFRDGLEVETKRLPSEAEYVRAFGAKDGTRRYGELLNEREFGRDLQALRQMTPAAQEEMLARGQAKGRTAAGTDGYALDSQRQDARQRAVEHDRKMRAADPAAYVLGADPAGRAAFDSLLQSGSPEDAVAHARRVRAGYAARGMDEDGPLLPKTYVREIGARFLKDEPKNAAALIMGEQERWGEHWPAVFAQMVLDKDVQLPGHAYAIGAGMPVESATLLAAAAQNLEFLQQATQLMPQAVKDVDNVLPDVFAPLGGTLRAQGGAKQESQLRDSCKQLALQYVYKGLDPDDAVEKAYKDMGGDRYVFTDSYRVPRGVNTDLVQEGARHYLATAGERTGELQAPQGEAWRSREELDILLAKGLARQGQWVTDRDEGGLVLYRGPFAVRKKDGGLVRLSWKELEDLGRTPEATRERLYHGE